MTSLEYMRSSPTLQLLKQLDVTWAVAQKATSQFGAIQDSAAAVATMNLPHHRWIRDMSEVTTSLKNGLQTWELQQSAAETAIESVKKNLATESVLQTSRWQASLAVSGLEDNPTQRALETMKRDWDLRTTIVRSVQGEWAVEADSFARLIGSWRQDLVRESASLATTWNAVQAARALDTIRFLRTFEFPGMRKISLDSAWATPVFLETLEPPRVPQIAPNHILARRPFKNYRMAESYDLLSDFERDLRDFIHDAMVEVFGMGWEKSRLPSGMYEKWEEKRQKARAAGEFSQRLIDYADFTEYVTIISQNNNWNEVFRSRFGRLHFVQESLYRLQPIRVCTMHSRILPHNMWQVLQTETMLLSDKMWN